MAHRAKLQVNTPLPEIVKVVTNQEAKQIYLTMNNNINIKTSNQNGSNIASIRGNNLVSIMKQKIYWYGVATGFIINVAVNLLSSYIYDLIKLIK